MIDDTKTPLLEDTKTPPLEREYYCDGCWRDVAMRNIIDDLRARLAEARAEAWDEGKIAGWDDCLHSTDTPNPYRDEAKR